MTLNLDDFLEALGGSKRFDHYVSGLCPFHSDKKPSLLVFEDGWFRCLGCGRVGSHQFLWNAIKRGGPVLTAPERAQWRLPSLPKRKEAVSDFVWGAHQVLVDVPSRGWYLENRGVAGRIIPCKLGWYEGWYTLPQFDSGGALIGVVLRAGPHIQKVSNERFCQPVGQKPTLYVPDWPLLGRSKSLVIVYGMFDALTLAELRVATATTTGGKDKFPKEWLDFWRGPIHILPDEGEEATARKLASELGWRGHVLKMDWPDGCKDANALLVKGHRDLLMATLSPHL